VSQPLTGSVLEVEAVRKTFRQSAGIARGMRAIAAVDGVDLRLERGRTVALVGESGCGKSTLARLILRLHKPDSGRIRLLGHEVQDLSERAFRPLRRHVQMVFQNPLGSFDPMHTIGTSVAETMRLRANGGSTEGAVGELLTEVGLSPRFAKLKPRAVSGGELQRAAIARALAPHPDLVVMDEPTSALDMSIQGQVLSLLKALQERHGLSYLIATHDLRTVRLVADEVMVMYLGQVVESGPTEEILTRPTHPYTRGLLYASDLTGRTDEKDRTVRIKGAVRTAEPGFRGCRLVDRCPVAAERCREEQELTEVGPGHRARCWRAVTGEYDEEGAIA